MGRGSVAARARTTFFRRPGRDCRRSRLPPIVPGPAHGAASVTARARTALFRRRASPAPAPRAVPHPARYGPAPARLPLPVATSAVACLPATGVRQPCSRHARGRLAASWVARYGFRRARLLRTRSVSSLHARPALLSPHGRGTVPPDPNRPVPPTDAGRHLHLPSGRSTSDPLRTRYGLPVPLPVATARAPCLPSPTRYEPPRRLARLRRPPRGTEGLPARPVATGARACLPRPVATGAGACLSPIRYGAAGLPAPNRRAAARLAAWAATPPVRTGPPRRRQSGGPRVQGSRVRCCRRCRRCWSPYPRCR